MSEPRKERGWFADVDNDQERSIPGWQPCVQTDSVCMGLDIWFQTKELCEAFIHDELLGLGMYP